MRSKFNYKIRDLKSPYTVVYKSRTRLQSSLHIHSSSERSACAHGQQKSHYGTRTNSGTKQPWTPEPEVPVRSSLRVTSTSVVSSAVHNYPSVPRTLTVMRKKENIYYMSWYGAERKKSSFRVINVLSEEI